MSVTISTVNSWCNTIRWWNYFWYTISTISCKTNNQKWRTVHRGEFFLIAMTKSDKKKVPLTRIKESVLYWYWHTHTSISGSSVTMANNWWNWCNNFTIACYQREYKENSPLKFMAWQKLRRKLYPHILMHSYKIFQASLTLFKLEINRILWCQ